MQNTTTPTGNSCPCKRIPMCLSSFTAAEHGDIHSLSRKEMRNRTDSAGNTPLHLAAQHGQTAATAFLLKAGYDVNTAEGGASSLHRASFSGAVSTMRILMNEEQCDLLMPDTSFGDRMTPLHKAVSGGRYMAVQLLVDELKDRGLLEQGLAAKDASGMTAHELAEELARNQTEESSRSVARWNTISSCLPDWTMCLDVLKKAGQQSSTAVFDKSTDSRFSGFNIDDCLKCQEGQECVTASWEAAFTAALSSSVRASIGDRPRTDAVTPTNEKRDGQRKDKAAELWPPPIEPSLVTTDYVEGKRCEHCAKVAIALYRSKSGHKLVCKSCKKLA